MAQKTVLIVEDEMPLLEALADQFEREGFQVLTASNGEEGFLLAQKHHPHIILLDLLMPRMNGVTMVKTIRKQPWGRTIPLIALTNLTSTEARQEVKAAGVSKVMIKANWSLADILKTVRELLGMKV